MTVCVTSENFKEEVLETRGKVLVDFWASWCVPCQMMMPIIDKISEEEEIKVCKVNVEEAVELLEKYQIMAVPTVLLMKKGKVKERLIGFHEKKDIMELVKK